MWDWASTDGGNEPDVVLACIGDVPTMETVAAAWLLRQHVPDRAEAKFFCLHRLIVNSDGHEAPLEYLLIDQSG